ncbi:MAG: hypothetical protein KatS3mg113_0478 [Planctomycetaceae bacterium]|nr:MAG: hypothetical protein KatS3mg113_0478 [Planctomycetaceae bacterium]
MKRMLWLSVGVFITALLVEDAVLRGGGWRKAYRYGYPPPPPYGMAYPPSSAWNAPPASVAGYPAPPELVATGPFAPIVAHYYGYQAYGYGPVPYAPSLAAPGWMMDPGCSGCSGPAYVWGDCSTPAVCSQPYVSCSQPYPTCSAPVGCSCSGGVVQPTPSGDPFIPQQAPNPGSNSPTPLPQGGNTSALSPSPQMVVPGLPHSQTLPAPGGPVSSVVPTYYAPWPAMNAPIPAAPPAVIEEIVW